MTDGRRRVDSVEELTGLIELEHLRFNRYAIERHDEPVDEEDLDDDPRVGVLPALSEDGTRIRVRIWMDYIDAAFTLGLTFEVLYAASEPLAPIADPVLGEFLGKSTMLTAIPFLREAVQSAGARLQVPVPVINLVRSQTLEPGEIP